ncbi:MAG: glycosyltransferase family 2 protein [Bacteroidota bacterium]|nr:glycosyltransferase family 2 protein [Bacteroidota bacterium]
MNKIKKGHSISIIIPVHNERDNLRQLLAGIEKHTQSITKAMEIIFVDDGSTDGSYELLKELSEENPNVKLIQFRQNFGQTAAMAAGIEHSTGDILIFMDADLQNDPADIPTLINKLNEGYDVVSGWRKNRKDKLFFKRIPSKLANFLIRKISKVKIHDLGCSLKAYRREILIDISLYGEMHRFLPVLAARIGAKITEIPVNHNPRKHGKSHYGLNRTFKVLLDLITVQFMRSFSTKPIYLYGGFALINLLLGMLSGLSVILMKIFWGTDMTGNPMLLLTVLFILITILLTLMGIQSEVLIRIYHQQGKVRQYYIKETQNINNTEMKTSHSNEINDTQEEK